METRRKLWVGGTPLECSFFTAPSNLLQDRNKFAPWKHRALERIVEQSKRENDDPTMKAEDPGYRQWEPSDASWRPTHDSAVAASHLFRLYTGSIRRCRNAFGVFQTGRSCLA
jgi:hypothetical protein